MRPYAAGTVTRVARAIYQAQRERRPHAGISTWPKADKKTHEAYEALAIAALDMAEGAHVRLGG